MLYCIRDDLGTHSRHVHALAATCLPSYDTDVSARHSQDKREQILDRPIRASLDRRGCHLHFECSLMQPNDRVLGGTRLDEYVDDAPVVVRLHEIGGAHRPPK
jgi:hypothetical protein